MTAYTEHEVETMTDEEVSALQHDVEPIFDAAGEFDFDATCESCPFCEVCGQLEMYWGCHHWETSMDEDL